MPRSDDGSSRLGRQVVCSTIVIALLIGGLVATHPRPREAPTVEHLLLSVRDELTRRGCADEAAHLDQLCSKVTLPECVQATFRIALDRKLDREALDLARELEDESAGAILGMRIEALARSARTDEARALLTYGTAETDPFAEYARAYLAYRAGDSRGAKRQVENAIRLGRGSPAHVLHAVLDFEAGDVASARRHSTLAVQLDPRDVNGVYNLAVVDQTEDQYHAAREGYLRALRLNPSHDGARYNLALLTHRGGAVAEARHNLEKLRGLVGSSDSRVVALEGLLGHTNRDIPADAPAARESGP